MRDPNAARRILFWPDKPGTLHALLERKSHKIKHPAARAILGVLADVGEQVIAQMGQHELGQPLEFVRDDVPDIDRAAVAKALAAGERGISYMGYAECRICGVRLGVADLYGHGYMWPERAEHYVTDHNVWTPGCADLLATLRGTP